MAQLMKNLGRIRSTSVRFKYLFLLATLCCCSFLIISVTNTTEILFLSNEQPLTNLDLNYYKIIHPNADYTIKTDGCTIPNLQPLDDSVRKFHKPPTRLKQCPNSNYSLIQYNETHIWIDTEVLQHYNVPNDGNVSCCYKSFYRPPAVNDVYSENVDDRVQYDTCVDFIDYTEVTDEFVAIICDYQRKTIYEQYFIFAIKKSMRSYSEESKNSEQRSQTNHTNSYNVVVMGIDSISRLNFHRTMPKTLAYLRKKSSIELLGYNKVADNTFPNLTPLLLGIQEEDLRRTCWPHRVDTFDNCPFIWQWYKDAGYYTALGEDNANLGTFNFGKFGFIKTPTDYYIRTFIHEAEINIGNTKDFNSYICMGNKYFFKVLLDYIADLTKVLKQSKLFGFFWEVSMSHDYLNYPMAMDESYENFLKTIDDTDYLDNTILILLSDHGIRWGGIRLTKQGRLEERLPFAHILLPQSFREHYKLAYDNVKQNNRRLTTPFDIYATLMDLINLETITDDKITFRIGTSYSNSRGISLFLPIPTNRTCESAGVADHWCTCNSGSKLSTKSFIAQEAAEQLVLHLNHFLEEQRQCAQLSLEEIVEVTEMMAGQPGKHEVGWREFMAVVRTSPGGGVFEGTLRHERGSWTLAGTVSRLNLYGDQSHCVRHYQLKLYCYCQ